MVSSQPQESDRQALPIPTWHSQQYSGTIIVARGCTGQTASKMSLTTEFLTHSPAPILPSTKFLDLGTSPEQAGDFSRFYHGFIMVSSLCLLVCPFCSWFSLSAASMALGSGVPKGGHSHIYVFSHCWPLPVSCTQNAFPQMTRLTPSLSRSLCLNTLYQ